MTDNTTSKLRVSKAEASKKIGMQINTGRELLERQPSSAHEFSQFQRDTWKWVDYNKDLCDRLFDKSPLPDWHGKPVLHIALRSLGEEIADHKESIGGWINELESIYERLDLYTELPNNAQQTTSDDTKKIFIGHGRSHVWRELKDFIEGILGLPYEEFNRVSAAGEFIGNRLEEMLDESCMAFLIMTGEDEQADGSLHARENVIHEAGLFQGRLGFKRAIILLEEGCQEFSNIHGLGHIPFPKGDIKAAFEEIRRVLKRESIM